MLTEFVSAVSRVIEPQSWLKSLASGWPWTSSDPGALIVVSGVIVPLSRPAAAVTTLKVEPGGYWPWVARLNSGEVGSALSRRGVRGPGSGRTGGFEASTWTRPLGGLDRDHGAEPGLLDPASATRWRFGVEVGDDVVSFLRGRAS